VGLDVLEQSYFPTVSTGLHHALLTLWAILVASAVCTVVFLLLRRQQQRLSSTAHQLTRLLESYQSNPSAPGRFENPHLVHCRQVLDCRQAECPMYDSPGQRCWQVMALRRFSGDNLSPRIEIEQCLKCEAYQRSCPDKLTELGESFNNLMFLLEAEAEQVGCMRTQMAEKEKMVAIGQIAAGIAHEVGNPLSSISSIVQMLKRADPELATTEQLDLLETHIQRISATVRRLVALARPVPDHWELVDFSHALEEVVRLIAFDRRARNVEIDVEPPESPVVGYGLRGQLQQVFLNISLNALDAMAQGGRLTVHLEKKNEGIIVRFHDTGCGISEEARQRLFEPFFTTKPPGEGTGLGLAVSHRIILKHGGTIDFNTVADQGTEFIVRLPVWDKAPDV
jgi:signal transduction histidine kinase